MNTRYTFRVLKGRCARVAASLPEREQGQHSAFIQPGTLSATADMEGQTPRITDAGGNLMSSMDFYYSQFKLTVRKATTLEYDQAGRLETVEER